MSDAPKDSKHHKKGPLKCIKDCVMPGIGEFHVGDTVDAADLCEKLADHPFFINESEDK